MSEEENMLETTEDAQESTQEAGATGMVPESLSEEEIRASLHGFGDVGLEVSVELGRARMPVSQFLKLSRGAIIELDKNKEDQVDVYVNGNLVANGDVALVEDTVAVSISGVVQKSAIPKR